LRRVDVVQPLLFAMHVALTDQWRAWGVEPDAVIGHSLGEVAAAVVARALSLEGGAKGVALRSRPTRPRCGHGRMAVVELSPAEMERELDAWPGVSIGSYQAPDAVLVSGGADDVQTLVGSLEARGVFARLADVDYASHSPQMDSVLDG